jgi:hypothetical protein
MWLAAAKRVSREVISSGVKHFRVALPVIFLQFLEKPITPDCDIGV